MCKRSSKRHSKRREGFTLIEMLVAVALVLLMMSMFSQIFYMSTEALSKQRGIAENDQRGRLVVSTVRSDLDFRTFRDVLPFRANEDTRQLGHSLARRAGYFEIDEGFPSDDTDDVLSFTSSVNIRLQNRATSSFVGNAAGQSPTGMATVTSVSGSTISILGDYTNQIAVGSRVWAVGTSPVGTAYLPYAVTSATLNGANTDIVVNTAVTLNPTRLWVSENDPEFDDGRFGNGVGTSAYAEISYFLRRGNLHRRVLLIREPTATGTAQPNWSSNVPLFWNVGNQNENYPTSGTTSTTVGSTSFWRDYDYSAFYYPGKNSPAYYAPGVRFHNAVESLNNSSQAPLAITFDTTPPMSTFPISLGIPHLRFGHSTTNGLPLDASAAATIGGTAVTLTRFTLQECSHAAFGYPGRIPADPITNNPYVNPHDRQNIIVNPNTGLVAEYTAGSSDRRGHDILMTNVLSFDVKVWDPVNLMFVDVGTSTVSNSPFGSGVGVITDNGVATGSIVGGRLNSTYGADNHYRFDTWHPNASIVGSTQLNEPPYFNVGPGASAPYIYNEPPFVPAAPRNPAQPFNAGTNPNKAFPLSAIQITIDYRDVSSGQIRQVTIVQSLVDQLKSTSVTNEAPEE